METSIEEAIKILEEMIENANIEKFESEKIKDERNAENLLQQKSKCATIDEVRRR